MYVAIEVARTFFAKAIHRDLVVSLHELIPSFYGIGISLKIILFLHNITLIS
jgi:hypothetical protein